MRCTELRYVTLSAIDRVRQFEYLLISSINIQTRAIFVRGELLVLIQFAISSRVIWTDKVQFTDVVLEVSP
jgi:hypothetical protein